MDFSVSGGRKLKNASMLSITARVRSGFYPADSRRTYAPGLPSFVCEIWETVTLDFGVSSREKVDDRAQVSEV